MANDINVNLNLDGERRFNQGLKDTADNLEKTGKSADKAGDGLDEMAKDAGHLDKRIGELKGGLKSLLAEFDRTGDSALKKQIKADIRELSELDRILKQRTRLTADRKADDGSLEQVVKAATGAGAEAGMKFGESFTKALMSLKGPAIAGAVGLAAAMAPVMGATISAAVLGGTGVGGIIGGIALAAQDARVQDAGSKLGEHLSAAFQRAASPFVAPAIEAMDLLRGVVDDVSASMREAFATVAPVLLPLTRGITGLITEAMPGFLQAMESAKPVIRSLANEFPAIGRAISQFFSDVAEDPDEAVMAVKALTSAIINLIKFAGGLVDVLGDIYEFAIRFGDSFRRAGLEIASFISILSPISGIYEAITGSAKEGFQASIEAADKAKDSSHDFAGSLDNVANSASKAQQEIIALQDAMDKAFGRTMDIQQATIGYEKSWDDAIETLTEGKRTLDATTEAGRENRGALLDNIEAVKSMRDANIENGMAVSDANAIYDRQIERLRQTAIKLGFNKDQVNELINAFDRLPADIELELRVKGLKGVIEQVKALAKLLGSKAAASAELDGSYVSGRASGGPVYPGQTYVVGENGPEVLQMGAASGVVYNAVQTRAMMGGAVAGGTSWSSAPAVAGHRDVVVLQSDGSAWSDAVMEGLRKALRDRGGNMDTLIELSNG